MRKIALLFFILAVSLPAAAAAQSYRLLSIALYQTNEVMAQRVGTSVDLVSYVKALNAAAAGYFDARPKGTPGLLDIVVAFKPSGKSKVWLMPQNTTLDNPAGLALRLQAVPAPKPVGGPIAFCLHASLWGGTEATPPTHPPYPKEWLDASTASLKPLRIPDDVLTVIWKD
ncbi:MAG: hypothetical protein ABSH19_07670 [Opitutales bacterium]|jgi:hypothetical protein